jgi:hypothetical protein
LSVLLSVRAMTPRARSTLQTYALRMGASWTDVKRDWTALSQAERGRMLVEMERVEKLFLAKLDKAERRRERISQLFAPLRWMGRVAGGALGTVLRWVRR